MFSSDVAQAYLSQAVWSLYYSTICWSENFNMTHPIWAVSQENLSLGFSTR